MHEHRRFDHTFLPRPDSVRQARAFVRTSLATNAAPVDHAVHEAAMLITSELATNAVRHAHTPYEVEVLMASDDIVISVTDGDPTIPTALEASDTRSGGRGLALVEGCSQEWGIERIYGGKRIWSRPGTLGCHLPSPI
jgi:anti-sigma regulatory factor (Ser/Thr protein kinase)